MSYRLEPISESEWKRYEESYATPEGAWSEYFAYYMARGDCDRAGSRVRNVIRHVRRRIAKHGR
jgi:hypothetical protein